MDIKYRQCTPTEFEAVFQEDHPEIPLWTDFSTAARASDIYGAEIDGKIRGAIAFTRVLCEECEDGTITLSSLELLYVSNEYRGNRIATNLLTYAIKSLAADYRTPIGCGITSHSMRKSFDKLPDDLKRLVKLSPTSLDDGYDIWAERNL